MGRMMPGQKLPPLRELAEQNGVSRSVVNAAVNTLAVQGFVRIVPRHHVVVSDFLMTGTLAIVGDVLQSDNVPLKRKLAQDTLALRLLLTSDAVRVIAGDPRIQLTPLQKILNHEVSWLQNPIKDYSRFWKLDMAFHEMLIRLGDNCAFRLLSRSFRYIAEGFIELYFHDLDFIGDMIHRQQELFAALKARDETLATRLCSEMLDVGTAATLKHYV
jgi:DNA-binding FadR family transcriptional regulator